MKNDEMNLNWSVITDPSPLPDHPVIAMAYVPFQQWSASLYTPEEALSAGTLFPELDKPFKGMRMEGNKK